MTTVGSVKLDTKRLDEIARKLNTNTDGALRKISAQVSGVAKRNILTKKIIDTGALWNSVDFRRISEGLYWVEDGVEYGIFHEFGTYKMAARPWLGPAAEEVAGQVGAVFEKELFK